MSGKKDNIDQFHTTGLYYPTKTIELSGEINLERYQTFLRNFHPLDDGSPITILLNSEGGDINQGRAIYDLIKNSKSHVTIKVYGEACSAATFILQAADERIMSSNSYLMLHIGEENHSETHPRNIEEWHKFNRILETWLEDVYLNKIRNRKKRFTRSQMKSLLQFDRVFLPKEALELGLIDNIE